MLKRLRVISALIFWVGITLLFLDFTGVAASWFGWMAKMQFLPALLAGNVIVIIGLVVLTLLFGRLYCSVICPLGVMQDGIAALGKKRRHNRYSYSPAKSLLRYVMLGVMVIAMTVGVGSLVALLAPYSTYGRMATNFLQPVWIWVNNLLAVWAEHHDSYAFYRVDMWPRSVPVLVVSVVVFVIIAVLAWRNGRTYCNTICPVGTVLGFLSRFSLLKPVIDTSKCVNCGKCARNCKGACIDAKNHSIDYSRCVTCFDCIDSCSLGAISYRRPAKKKETGGAVEDAGRRGFLTVSAIAGVSLMSKAQFKVDGGLAEIQDRKPVKRATALVPAGAHSVKHLSRHCTGCQLCVAACPNGVLCPSLSVEGFMQPEMSYERGYCRPECTRCSEVCPTGAIHKITREEKSAISIGHAVVIKENCIAVTDGHSCGNCERHCPTGAITMVKLDGADDAKLSIPKVDTERCIGCGACENLCPARPVGAIYVEGNNRHREI